MMYEYMKKHLRVIIILLTAAALIIAVRLLGSSEPEREFYGTFIRSEHPKIVRMHDFN